MFKSLKNLFKAADEDIVIFSPVEGEAVPVCEVSDPTFGEEILGKGAAIRPTKGRVVSPVDGMVSIMFETGHAVSIISSEGVELLIHVGLDTIKLGGQFYKAHKQSGDPVKKGDLLIEFDIAAITAAGYDIITPVVVCNTSEYAQVEARTGHHVLELEELLRLKK